MVVAATTAIAAIIICSGGKASGSGSGLVGFAPMASLRSCAVLYNAMGPESATAQQERWSNQGRLCWRLPVPYC